MEGGTHHGVLLKAFWKNKLFLCKFYSFRFDGRGVRRTPLEGYDVPPLPSKRKLKFLVSEKYIIVLFKKYREYSVCGVYRDFRILQTYQKIMLNPKENWSNFAVFLKGRDAKSQNFLAAYRPGEFFPTLSTIFDRQEFFELDKIHCNDLNKSKSKPCFVLSVGWSELW